MLRHLLALLAIVFAGQQARAVPAAPLASAPLVILVSIDGFRADYLQRGRTPALADLAAHGVRSTGMRPAFPSITFPNHYTLVTGLYPDHHGVVANTMLDPAITPDSRFAPSDFTAVSDARWWDEATPIWVTARQQGLRTATMFWPGSEAAIQGVRPDLWAHFDASLTPNQRVDIVLDWLDLPPAKRPGFVTLYFDEVDHEGHLHGPDSAEVDASLALVDAAVARLRDGLKARGLAADLVVVADHGMAAISPDRRVVLDDYVDMAHVKLVTGGAVAELAPEPGADTSRLLAARGHMRCWRKADIPARLHYGTNPRIPPLVCLADPGWMILTRESLAKLPAGTGGEHGYDPASPLMAALFLAAGPDFRSGQVIAPFDNVDVYPLLIRLLGLKAPPGDGSMAPLRGALVQP